MKTQIKVIDFGIAFRIGNTIYLHKNLDKYPELKKAVLSHEFNHSEKFSLRDVKLDLTGRFLRNVKRDYYYFLFHEPRAWLQLSPIIRLNNEYVYDITMLAFWCAALILIIAILLI